MFEMGGCKTSERKERERAVLLSNLHHGSPEIKQTLTSLYPPCCLNYSLLPLFLLSIHFYECPETGNLLICKNAQQSKPVPSVERGDNERFPRN